MARKKRELEIDPQHSSGKPADESRKESSRKHSKVEPDTAQETTPEAPNDHEEHADGHAGVETEKQFPRCPNCGWRNVRFSHITGPVDTVMKMFSIMPFRCRSCGTRFRRRWIVRSTKEDA